MRTTNQPRQRAARRIAREKSIRIRVSLAEHEWLFRLARKRGLSLTQFMLSCAEEAEKGK